MTHESYSGTGSTTATASIAAYFARDWATGRSREEIEEAIARSEHKARHHTYQWNEVGNATYDYAWADTLRDVLGSRASQESGA